MGFKQYGVTWATPEHSVAQTGYIFATVGAAQETARAGPAAASKVTRVDAMCKHYPNPEWPLFGLVQTEDSNIIEVTVDEVKRNWTDEHALNEIAQGMRTEEWSVSFLEDIAEIVGKTGRNISRRNDETKGEIDWEAH